MYDPEKDVDQRVRPAILSLIVCAIKLNFEIAVTYICYLGVLHKDVASAIMYYAGFTMLSTYDNNLGQFFLELFEDKDRAKLTNIEVKHDSLRKLLQAKSNICQVLCLFYLCIT